MSPQPQQIAIISSEIGWGCGLRQAEKGPELLLEAGIVERLQARLVRIIANPSMDEVDLNPEEVEEIVMKHAIRVSNAVLDAVQKGMFPVVIGGDHTSALGFHTGLARAFGETGIVWIDTHPDLNTFKTSPSGNIHGMVLAGLLGRGSQKMLQTTSTCQTKQEHVAMLGVRDIDEGEQKWLDEGVIRCFTMDIVRERGLFRCLLDATGIANQADAGFGLTIDIDAIDPSQAPFVATPVENGIDAQELSQALSDLPRNDRLLGMEVAEFTPRSDEDAEIACQLIVSLVTAVTGTPVV